MGDTVRVGIIGLGFMGGMHLAAYRAAARDGHPCRVVALADRNRECREPRAHASPAAPRGNLDDVGGAAGAGPSGELARALTSPEVTVHADPAHLIADPAIDLVSICTPTDSHVALAAAALAAGKHVLVEKPVALEPDAIVGLARQARAAGRRCLPAHCMRFWPGWDLLPAVIRAGEHGLLRELRCERLGAPPAWSRDFYGDPRRSGSALVDLHVHDADFIAWCLGTPVRVESTGTVEHVRTRYHFAAGAGPALPLASMAGLPPGSPSVSAEGGWIEGREFTMGYTATFEDGLELAWRLRAGPRGEPLLVERRDGASRSVPVPGTGYDGEVRHLLAAIADPLLPLRATLEEAAAVACVLAAERLSLACGRPVEVDLAPLAGLAPRAPSGGATSEGTTS